MAIDTSPPIHRLRPEEPFNKDLFKKRMQILGIRIPASETTQYVRSDSLKGNFLNIPRERFIQIPEDDEHTRILLLNHDASEPPPIDIASFVSKRQLTFCSRTIDLDYSNWGIDEILRSTLPENLLQDVPSAFTVSGHLVHMNLREEYLPYKHVIGQVILEKIKSIRTVVNKVDSIDNEFRVFKMEVLAGEPDFIVEVHESNCKFTFDFSQVYWNSRLHAEHERLVKLFDASDVVADVFAGVGPFAIPAAKKGCIVFANDLNPNSTKYMQANCVTNKVAERVRVTTMDGRAFIRQVLQEVAERPLTNVPPIMSSKERAKLERQRRLDPSAATNIPDLPPKRRIDHFVMNLPATAIEFLDAFSGAFQDLRNVEGAKALYTPGTMPTVHCHCFTRELEREKAIEDIRERATQALGYPLEDASYHWVRSVAPNKDMYCFSFTLPYALLENAKQ